jgi:hypothetical protein
MMFDVLSSKKGKKIKHLAFQRRSVVAILLKEGEVIGGGS